MAKIIDGLCHTPVHPGGSTTGFMPGLMQGVCTPVALCILQQGLKLFFSPEMAGIPLFFVLSSYSAVETRNIRAPIMTACLTLHRCNFQR